MRIDYLKVRNFKGFAEREFIFHPEVNAEYRDRLAESIAPYADNPAFQAFLEIKRATKLRE